MEKMFQRVFIGVVTGSVLFTFVVGMAPTTRPNSTNTTVVTDEELTTIQSATLRLHWATTRWEIDTFGPIGYAKDGEGFKYIAVGPRWYMVGK